MRLIKNSVSLALTKARAVARRSSSTAYCLLPTACLFMPSQSALHPAGPQAGRIISLWWMMFYVTGTVFLIVMGFLVAALARRRRPYGGEAADVPDTKPEPSRERRMTHVVLTGVGITVVILFVFLVRSYVTGRALDSLHEQEHLTVKVVGHQWWWEVSYDNSTAAYTVTTANEIHVPVGRLVRFHLESRDVIHSFWVPNLHGKKDLVPNNPAETYLRADRPGEYWGQCAEFCGLQHAHMRLLVVAEPPEQFEAWLAAQKKPAPPPSTESQSRGQQIFLSGTCVMCHTVAGTPARGTVGPNLTHVASNKTIAAGSLANTRENLARWVTDSQSVKPGTRMPPHTLAPEDLEAVLDYLESLK